MKHIVIDSMIETEEREIEMRIEKPSRIDAEETREWRRHPIEFACIVTDRTDKEKKVY